MPRKENRVRIERGLYRSGNVYFACATPLASRKVVWKKLGAVGLMEARRLRDEFAAETRRAPAAPRSRRVTYGKVVAEWLSDQEARVAAGDLARSALGGYRDELERHILPVFGGRQVASITPDDLVRWHRDMQRRGLSAWSIKHAWAPLRLVLPYAVRHYGLPGNPADALLPQERPKPGEDRKRFLNRKEIGSLLDAAVDPYRLPIATAIFSGLRIGELLGLTWEDIDFKAGIIKVRFQAPRPGERARLKTPAARRDVILMPELGSDLRRHRLASPWAGPQDIVFASKTGTSPDQRNVANRGLKIACREAAPRGRELPRAAPHVRQHPDCPGPRRRLRLTPARPRQRGDHAEGLRALVRRGQACGDGAAAAERGLPGGAAAAPGAGEAAGARRVSVSRRRHADRRRRQHRQQLARQRLARAPELEADDLPRRGVQIAQAPGRFLGDDGAAVVALGAQPGDVGVAVVVAVDLRQIGRNVRDRRSQRPSARTRCSSPP